MRSALLLLLLATTACSGTDIPPLPLPMKLLLATTAHADRHPDAQVAVAYLDLRQGEPILLQGDVVMHAASTMKVPVMIELFRRADRGVQRLDDTLEVRNHFASIVGGSPYSLSPDDDSDPELYREIGKRLTVRELIGRMITRSSNLATNLLIGIAGPEHVQETIEGLGTTHTHVRRGVEDMAAFHKGLNNETTARDLMVLMTAIARGEAASPAACREMVDILLRQEHDGLIPRGLPHGTPVAHKTGQITGILHDAAIVDPRGTPYVLVVMTRGFADPAQAADTIADVARTVSEQRAVH